MSHPSITGTRVIDPFAPDPRLFVRWFVQYNPLFTASALCVLGGVLLVGRALGDSSVALLTGVVELYQWLVIGTAGLLYRRLNEHRPGVILGLIAAVFLVDPTLQVSALATAGHEALTIAWVALTALKVWALVWAFCLRLNRSAYAVVVLGAAAVAALPHMRMMEDVADLAPSFLAVAVCAVSALAAIVRPTMTSARALSEVGAVMFPRLQRAIVGIAVLGVAYQGINAVFAIGPQAMLAIAGAMFLAVVMHARTEQLVWIALVPAALLLPKAVSVTFVALPLAAFALLIASRHHAPRVMAAGLFIAAMPAYAKVEFGGPFAEGALIVVCSLALIAVAVTRRAPSAVVAMVAMHARFVVTTVFPVVFSSAKAVGHLGWGALLVSTGFVLLPLGVVAHRRLSKLVQEGELPWRRTRMRRRRRLRR